MTEPISSREFKKRLVSERSGMAMDIEEECKRYVDEEAKIACLAGAKQGLAKNHPELDRKDKRNNFTAMMELKEVQENLEKKYGRPEKIWTKK